MEDEAISQIMDTATAQGYVFGFFEDDQEWQLRSSIGCVEWAGNSEDDLLEAMFKIIRPENGDQP